MIDLKKIETMELANELAARAGVERAVLTAGMYSSMSLEGPVEILAIKTAPIADPAGTEE